MRAPDLERLARVLRRTLLTAVLTPIGLAAVLTLVDAYRSRGKRPKPFPVTPPRATAVGEGTITTYTFGQDLYADMIRAIEEAKRQVLFETYIWKGDEVGQRFKSALADAAARGVEVYCVFDSFANLVVPPRFKRMPAGIKVLRYPAAEVLADPDAIAAAIFAEMKQRYDERRANRPQAQRRT